MSTIISIERITKFLLRYKFVEAGTTRKSIANSFIIEFTTIVNKDQAFAEIEVARSHSKTGFETNFRIEEFVRNAVGKEIITNLVEEEWDFTERPIALLEDLASQKIRSAKIAFTAWKLLEAFSTVFRNSVIEHNSSINQRLMQLETRAIPAIRNSINEAQKLLDTLNAFELTIHEEFKAKEQFYKLKREAQLLTERLKS
jgi:hypothetical protein